MAKGIHFINEDNGVLEQHLPSLNLMGGYIRAFLSQPSSDLIANVNTLFSSIIVKKTVLPVTLNNEEYDNSYVCSPYTAYISYAIEELSKLKNPILEKGLRVVIQSLARLLRNLTVNKVVHINNWLLSTNLYPDLTLDDVEEITRELMKRHPEHLIVFRSLNDHANHDLCLKLAQTQYHLLPSRQVYIFDHTRSNYLRKKNSLEDLKLLNATNYQIVEHDNITEDDYSQILHLYNLLYLEKYSYHNPQFTINYIRLCHMEKWMKFWGLRNNQGILDGIVGVFQPYDIRTVPIVGYNTHLHQKTGLYRMLMALVLRDSFQKKIVLNLSSGAAQFKRLRGGEPFIEYSAVYCRHLPWKQRCLVRSMQFVLTGVGIPIMRKYGL